MSTVSTFRFAAAGPPVWPPPCPAGLGIEENQGQLAFDGAALVLVAGAAFLALLG